MHIQNQINQIYTKIQLFINNMKDKERLGQEPAFAYQITIANGDKVESIGMSKRFYAACAAMQGLLSASYYNLYNLESNEVIVKKSYSIADELLSQENL